MRRPTSAIICGGEKTAPCPKHSIKFKLRVDDKNNCKVLPADFQEGTDKTITIQISSITEKHDSDATRTSYTFSGRTKYDVLVIGEYNPYYRQGFLRLVDPPAE